MSIYKVFYQEDRLEIPIRENTKSLYIEADDEREIVKYLEEKEYNVEYIQKLSEQHLEFEKNTTDFVLEKING